MEYILLYENGTEIERNMPGTVDEEFTLEKYHKEIGKDYKQITFYLCKNNDLTVKRKLESFQDDELYDEVETKRIHLEEESGTAKIDTLENFHVHCPNDLFDGMLVDPVNSEGQFVTEQTNDWQITKQELIQQLKANIVDGQIFFVIRGNAPLQLVFTIWKREMGKAENLRKRLMVHFAGEDGIDDGALSKTFLTKLHLQFSMVVYQKTRCCMYRMEILELVGKLSPIA